MRRTHIVFVLGISALLTLSAGCESMDMGSRRTSPEMLSGGTAPALPEGTRGQERAARPRGAWSSDAADIEKNLTRRNADPNW